MPAVRSVAWRLKIEGDEIAVQKLTGVGTSARKAIEPVPGLLRGVNAASQEFQGTLEILGGRLGSVGAVLGRMGPIGMGVAASLGAVALAAHQVFTRTRDADKFADNIERSAQRLKLGAEAYQEIAAGAKEFNIEQGEVNSGLAVLRDNINQFIAGINRPGGAGAALKALGLTRQDLAQAASFEQQLNMIANALARVDNASVRDGIADRLGMTTLLPMLVNGAAGLERLREEARKSGQVMENSLVKTGADGNREYEKLSNAISVKMHSAFVGFTPLLLRWHQLWADLAGFGARFVQTFQSIPNKSFDGLRQHLQQVADALEKAEAAKKRAEEIGPGYVNSDSYKGVLERIKQLQGIRRTIMQEIGKRITESDQYQTDSAAALARMGAGGKKGNIVLPPTQEEINAAKAAAEAAAREQMQRAEQSLRDQDRLYEQRVRFMEQLGVAVQRSEAERIQAEHAANVESLRGKEGYYKALIAQANAAAASEIAIIDAQVSAQLAALDKLRQEYEDAGLQMPGYDDARQRILKGGDDQKAAINARRLQDITGISREARGAIGNLVEEITGPLDLALRQVGAGALQGFTETLVGISMGAKDAGEAVGDMVTSIIADLDRMATQRLITAPLGNALDAAISSFLGGGLSPVKSTPMVPIPTHAEGGRAGLFTRINERGGFPEALMTPGGDVSILSSPTSLKTVVDAVRRAGGAGAGVMMMAPQAPIVEINNYGEPVREESRQYDAATNTLKIDLQRQVMDGVRHEIRNGGIDGAMRDRFGAGPSRRRRE